MSGRPSQWLGDELRPRSAEFTDVYEFAEAEEISPADAKVLVSSSNYAA